MTTSCKSVFTLLEPLVVIGIFDLIATGAGALHKHLSPHGQRVR
jgi:hypothetical protein